MAPTRPLALLKVKAQNYRTWMLYAFSDKQPAVCKSASIHYNTLKVRKIHSYCDILGKPLKKQLFIFFIIFFYFCSNGLLRNWG